MSSVFGRLQRLPLRGARWPALPLRWWPRWQYLYFALAAFDVLTVLAGLYLTHTMMDIYRHSASVNQTWAERVNAYSELGELAAEVNAPGNDIFHTRDVDGEAKRMREAKRAFDREFGILRLELVANLEAGEAAPLVAKLDHVSAMMDAMTFEAGLIFAAFRANHPAQAGERMAAMDDKYARLNHALRDLRQSIAVIQQRNFNEQNAAAAKLNAYEWVLALLIFFMLAGATLYGHRLARKMHTDAAEKERHLREIGEAHALLGDTNQRLQAFLRRTLEAQEKERQEIARELHEEIAQMLGALKLRLGSIELAPQVRKRVEPTVSYAGTIAQTAIDRLQELVHNLTPHGMECIGLAGVLRAHLQEWTYGSGVRLHFSEQLLEERPPFEVETAAYRVAEEAVSNVVRHAHARNLHVELSQTEAELQMAIRDDGVGFHLAVERAAPVNGSRLGITQMEQRTALVGGRIEVDSAPGRGTAVRAIFPIRRAPESG